MVEINFEGEVDKRSLAKMVEEELCLTSTTETSKKVKEYDQCATRLPWYIVTRMFTNPLPLKHSH